MTRLILLLALASAVPAFASSSSARALENRVWGSNFARATCTGPQHDSTPGTHWAKADSPTILASECLLAPKWTSKDPNVAEIANRIEDAYPGHVKGVNTKVDGHEVDIELQNAIIEVKSGNGKGLTRQVKARQGLGKPVIGHAPNLGPHTARSINEAGGIASGGAQGTLDDLIEVVAP